MSRVNLPLGDIGHANDRIIRMTNVHYDATPEHISKFFSRFTIVDQIRDYNVRTRTHSVVYILFATQKERIEAESLSGQYLFDRLIKIQPAPKGTYTVKDDQSGFVRKDDPPSFATARNPSTGSPQLSETEFPPLHPPSRQDQVNELGNDPLQSRILFMNGIHPDAKDNDIRAYLSGFSIADIKRMVNPRNGKYLPTAFILLEATEDRARIVRRMKGMNMHGRPVTLEVPKKFVKGFELSTLSASQSPNASASATDQDTVYSNARTTQPHIIHPMFSPSRPPSFRNHRETIGFSPTRMRLYDDDNRRQTAFGMSYPSARPSDSCPRGVPAGIDRTSKSTEFTSTGHI